MTPISEEELAEIERRLERWQDYAWEDVVERLVAEVRDAWFWGRQYSEHSQNLSIAWDRKNLWAKAWKDEAKALRAEIKRLEASMRPG